MPELKLEFEFHCDESENPISIIFLWGGAYKKPDGSIHAADGWWQCIGLRSEKLRDDEYLSQRADHALAGIERMMNYVLADKAKGRFCLRLAGHGDMTPEDYTECLDFRFFPQREVKGYVEANWGNLPEGFWEQEYGAPTLEYVRNAISACAAQRPVPRMPDGSFVGSGTIGGTEVKFTQP